MDPRSRSANRARPHRNFVPSVPPSLPSPFHLNRAGSFLSTKTRFTMTSNNERRGLDRRTLIKGTAASALTLAAPSLSLAQSKTLVAATFPGTWSEADRQVILPAFKQLTGASVTQSIVLGTDQVSRLVAAKGNKPPFDVAFFDAPQVIDAVRDGLIAEYPIAQSPNYKDLLPEAQDKWGPKITMQVIGIGYNPNKIKTPPTSWDDLWDPKYKGRVGLTALNSQLGIAFIAELNRIKGGTDDNFDPAFAALRELLPNVGAIG